MAYAHAVIEYPRDLSDPDKGYERINRGDSVPNDLPGIDELREAGSVRDEQYDPADEPKLVPEYVEIDGVRYVKTGDGATTTGESNA